MLRRRLITAMFLVPAIIFLVYYPSAAWFQVVMVIVVSMMAWELSRLLGLIRLTTRVVFLMMVLLSLWLVQWLPSDYLIMLAVLAWCYFTLALYRFAKQAYTVNFFIVSVLNGLLLLGFYCAVLHIRQLDKHLLMTVLIYMWTADTGAYITGKLLGRHKLAPAVSPGKTIEGVLGGIVFSLLAAVILLNTLIDWKYSLISWLVLAIITVLFSIVGDLYISMLKRSQGLKDAGKCLPGHGGLLDRFDSLLCAATMFSFGLMLLPIITQGGW